MLRAIAIDDEPIALEIIKNLAAEVPFIDLKACFTSALSAVSLLHQQQVDLLFLDIKMPGLSGLDFIKSINQPPLVIFTTAYTEHAVQSFELNAIDYLLKPFSSERFLKACNKAAEQFELRRTHPQANGPAPALFIKSGYEHIRVTLSEIIYAESLGNYVRFQVDGPPILSRLTMNETETMLPNNLFIRIHRSYIVARHLISRIDKTSVWVGQTELPVGSAYRQELDNLIKNNS
ncbi:LytR/AlgR family response regulator transcription factor [Pedobacter sp. PWIIR3]